MRGFSRRALLAAGLGATTLLLPRRVSAGGSGERKFLFVFCPGGWDVCDVYAPLFNDAIDHQPGDQAAVIGDFTLTDGATRPSVRSFFELWGSKTCLINGMQVPSVAHDVCTRLTMTGTSNDGFDDWASIIAGNTVADRILPNVHLSGPIFPSRYVQASVRVGLSSQLAKLVDGSALLRSDTAFGAVSAERDALEEAFMRARVDRWATTVAPGEPARIAAAEQLAYTRSARLVDVADDLTLDLPDLYNTLGVAVRALGAGLSRSGVVSFGQGANGWWDTHSDNAFQAHLFEALFDALLSTVTDMASMPGEVEATLLDETTIVVLSEMGRTPGMNSAGGKDHWTWTSALLIGSGVQGGRTIGGWTDGLTGRDVDLASGVVDDDGVTLTPSHLGATLLRLADIDPAEFIDPAVALPIEGVLA